MNNLIICLIICSFSGVSLAAGPTDNEVMPVEHDNENSNDSTMTNTRTQFGLEASDWQLKRYRDASDQMLPVLPDTTVTARFNDGKVSGHAGCNTFNASYEITDDRISMGPAMTTRMHCAEPDGIMEQEQEYLAALSRAQVFELTDNGLKLRDENGSLQVNFVAGDTAQ